MTWQPFNAATEQSVVFSECDWPILLHGVPKSGLSFYTIVLTADLIRRGERVVFICAKGEAIRSLQTELDLITPAAKYSQIDRGASQALEAMQLVTIMNRPNFDLLAAVRNLKDWGERIVVVKNADALLSKELWSLLRPHHRLIIAGDLKASKIKLAPSDFSTAIYFSPPPATWSVKLATRPTYVGHVYQANKNFLTIVRDL